MRPLNRPDPSQQDSNRRAVESQEAGPSTKLMVQSTNVSTQTQQEEEDEGDEEMMDISTIQSFADKVQHDAASESRPKITIPKRGEKDFEPLAETVNLQEMMLQRSREALFGALQGVRGTNSKAMAHALLTPKSPYPRMLITRGHLMDTMGISVRYQPLSTGTTKAQTFTELLPEEALYLLERGTLQIWVGRDPETEEDESEGLGRWCEMEYGVRGAVEMSVMEAYGLLLNNDGLNWERYQAYATLKRLGYTVHRPRRFLPRRLTGESSSSSRRDLGRRHFVSPSYLRSWFTTISKYLNTIRVRNLRFISTVTTRLWTIGIRLGQTLGRRRCFRDTLLSSWYGVTYASLFSHLRMIPSGHDQPLPTSQPIPQPIGLYGCLESNPYIPFWHVWKPAVTWSKAKWDRGSEEGLLIQRPDFHIAVIEARNTSIPTLCQLAEVFDLLPDEPKGAIKKVGPQYERTPRNRPSEQKPDTLYERLAGWLPGLRPAAMVQVNQGNPMGALRNGDKGLVVAVNDSGNTGWVRFGRSGFAEAAVI